MTQKDSQKQPIITIEQLQQNHIDKVASLLTRSFLSLNRIWKKFNLTYDEVKYVLRGKIISTLGQKFSFVIILLPKVILQDGIIVGSLFHMNILDYLVMPQMPHHIQFFKLLSEVGLKLQKSLDKKTANQGKVIYGLYAVIDPQYSKKGISFKIWWQIFSMIKISGYEHFSARVSSEVSLAMLKKLGGTVVSETLMEFGEIKEKMWMINLDFRKPFPNYKECKSMIKLHNPKSKL